mmetsp:Transcript_11837/g.30353  ORF Transcript_11837/g.30353 Transcript_11837/m.30353 type:complete len:206 (+) Transcript_11837:52-669(+)
MNLMKEGGDLKAEKCRAEHRHAHSKSALGDYKASLHPIWCTTRALPDWDFIEYRWFQLALVFSPQPDLAACIVHHSACPVEETWDCLYALYALNRFSNWDGSFSKVFSTKFMTRSRLFRSVRPRRSFSMPMLFLRFVLKRSSGMGLPTGSSFWPRTLYNFSTLMMPDLTLSSTVRCWTTLWCVVSRHIRRRCSSKRSASSLWRIA